MEKVVPWIIGIGVVVLLFLSLSEGINRSEVAECKRWAEQAKQYQGFYLTKAEAEQCERWGVEVGAPVLR